MPFSIVCIYPLIYLVFYSLKTNEEIFYVNSFGIPTDPQFQNYVNAVKAFNIVGYFKNSIIPLAILVKKMHMDNTYFALIVPYIAFNLAFSSMILATSFASLLREMEESAFIDGVSVYFIWTFWLSIMASW